MMRSKKLLSTFLYIYFAVFASVCPGIEAARPGELRRKQVTNTLQQSIKLENHRGFGFGFSMPWAEPIPSRPAPTEATADIETLCGEIIQMFSTQTTLPSIAAINRAIVRTGRFEGLTNAAIDTAISCAIDHLSENLREVRA